jgi:hypothetical protein
MEVPYEHAKLTVYCAKHNQTVEFVSDEDAESILDRMQLSCESANIERDELCRQLKRLEAAGSRLAHADWAKRHPEEARQFPADYQPRIRPEYFEPHYQAAIKEVKVEIEGTREDHLNWIVTLEEVKNNE